MEKIYTFLEKITQNSKKNGAFMAISLIILCFSIVLLTLSLVFSWSITSFIVVLCAFSFSSTVFFAAFERIRKLKDALDTSERYIKKIEEENTDYKMMTEVLLNDPAIARIMNARAEGYDIPV